MKLFALIITTALLVACSSTPTPINQAQTVSHDHVFKIEPLANEKKFSTFKILRDSASDDMFMSIEIWIDGELNATLSSEELHTQKLDPKDHIIEARVNTSFGRIGSAQVETIFREGRTYFYRVGYNATSRTVTLLRDVSLSK
jgi:hypothetical protein